MLILVPLIVLGVGYPFYFANIDDQEEVVKFTGIPNT
jgi:hypothetical protein